MVISFSDPYIITRARKSKAMTQVVSGAGAGQRLDAMSRPTGVEDFAARLNAQREAFVQGESSRSSHAAHLLAHPFLAGPLLSSADLKAQIDASDKTLQIKQAAAAQAHQELAQSVQTLSHRLGKRRDELVQLPEEIGSLEDALLALCTEVKGAQTDNNDGDARASTSSTTLQILEKQHALLAQLTATRDYLSVLARAEDLKLSAIKAEGAQNDGLPHLAELSSLASRVKALGEGHKASTFVQAQCNQAFAQLAKIREGRLASALEAIGWPPQPPELQMAAASQAQGGSKAAPEELLARDEEVRRRWADLMILQRRSEKLGVLRPSSSRLDYTTPHDVVAPGSADFQPLLTVQVLLRTLLLRFYYHFDSERSTNRLDKPEWYLGHMLALIRSHGSLFDPRRGALASLSANVQQKSGDIRYDLHAELLHGILRPLDLKLESSIPLLLERPQLLSHTIMQVVTFDQELRGTLNPVSPRYQAIHLADTLLSKESVFEAWVQSERTFASTRLEEELESGGAWLVGNEDGVDDEATAGSWESMRQDTDEGIEAGQSETEGPNIKTTRSARAVVSLIDGLTARYRALHIPSHQLPFLLIQLSIFQQYAQRLERSLEAFESLSSAFSRHIPGGIAGAGSGTDPSTAAGGEADMVRGLRGLGRLLKACLSAVYITQHLEALSATSFFLILGTALGASVGQTGNAKLLEDFRKWEGDSEERELDHASLGELVRKGWRTGNRFASSIRPLGSANTSQPPSRPSASPIPGTPQMGAFPLPAAGATSIDVFEKSRQRFEALTTRALTGMEKLVTSEVLEGMRTYAQRDWNEDEDGEDEEAMPIDEEGAEDVTTLTREGGDMDVPTASLVPCLSVLSNLLTHVLPSLPRALAHRVYRSTAQALSNAVVERVVFAGGSHRFSTHGATRFHRDVHEGWLVVAAGDSRIAVATGRRPHAPWRFLIDAATLLSLPVQKTEEREGHASITLSEASQAAFGDEGQGWPAVQEAIGIDDRMALRVARELLRRRIDCPW